MTTVPKYSAKVPPSIQTPDLGADQKGWNTLFRLYAPLQPWFDKSWKPGDFERID